MTDQKRTGAIPLVEEELRVDKQPVTAGKVSVHTVVDAFEEVVRETLESERVEVSRVSINREVQTAPAVRTEGDMLIIPVLEEVLVVEKRLVLKEELHVRRLVSEENVEIPMTVRKQRAVVERITPGFVQPRGRGTMSAAAMTTRTITAFFDNREDASDAIQRLQTAGIPRTDINMVEGSRSGSSPTQETAGFWESLKEMFLPDEDRYTYAEGLRRGGYLVTVRTNDAHYERALDILDDEGTIDIDERAASWRNEGWTTPVGGSAGASSMSSSTGSAAERAATPKGAVAGSVSRTASAGSSARDAAGSLSRGDEEVIPLTEEQLRVGKRDVSHGRVRVRSYTVETPVQEQVNLRDEHVTVERRPVDRPVAGDENLFRERTIEAEERAEEAVVDKQARVKEELVIKKDVGQRSETVSDTVRRTEVEVDDQRAKTSQPSKRTSR